METNFFDPTKKSKTFIYLEEIETLNQETLNFQREKLRLHNARNKFIEAFQALKDTEDRNVWIELGSVYVQRPKTECIKILQEDIDKLEVDIKEISSKIRENVVMLRDLEHQPRIEGIYLKPMSAIEAKVIRERLTMPEI